MSHYCLRHIFTVVAPRAALLFISEVERGIFITQSRDITRRNDEESLCETGIALTGVMVLLRF